LLFKIFISFDLDILWDSFLDLVILIFYMIITTNFFLRLVNLHSSFIFFSLNCIIWIMNETLGRLLIQIRVSVHSLNMSRCIRIPEILFVSFYNLLTKLFLMFIYLVWIHNFFALSIKSFWILIQLRLSVHIVSLSILLILLIGLRLFFFFLIFIVEYFHVNFIIHLYFLIYIINLIK